MKKAFTMVELIFVIVIIGILAAVAIPKMNATRNDAKVAVLANNVATSAAEISAYAVSHGTTTIDFSAMSNAVTSMISNNEAVQNNNTLNIRMNTVNDCLRLVVERSALDANLTITYGNAANDVICQSLQSAIHADDYPIALGGNIVKY